ncbi:MAG: RNA 2',3'-cyclic phosphodiesterase [Steroidobacteraceae bacterium]
MTAAGAHGAHSGPTAQRRIFFALWGTQRFCQRLAAVAAPMLAAVPGRPVVPADWHVTLCFLGAVNEQVLASLRALAGQLEARAFALQFDGIEYWRQARVIAATAATVPQAAQDLAVALRGLARSAALSPDERPLRPHVTLMRGVSAPAWRAFCNGATGAVGGAAPEGHGLAAGWAAPGQRGLTELALEARELHLAESVRLADDPAAPAGRAAAGRSEGARRYVTLAHWPLRTSERCTLADSRPRHL